MQAGDDVYLRVTEYTRPTVWYRVPGGSTRAEPTALRIRSSVDLSNLEVTREVAVSRDGTEVPMTIVRARNVPRDGTAPGILTGYGGYTISMTPHFLAKMAPRFEHGGGRVEANLRGGSGVGDAGHRAGRLPPHPQAF